MRIILGQTSFLLKFSLKIFHTVPFSMLEDSDIIQILNPRFVQTIWTIFHIFVSSRSFRLSRTFIMCQYLTTFSESFVTLKYSRMSGTKDTVFSTSLSKHPIGVLFNFPKNFKFKCCLILELNI